MLKTEVVLVVPKETHEFAEGIAVFVAALAKEIKDNGGFAVGDDLPGIAAAAIALVPAIHGAMSLGADFHEDPVGFSTCWALAGAKIASTIIAE